MPRSQASAAARSESSMNTMPLTDETAPPTTQSAIIAVVWASCPQSSALTMSRPCCSKCQLLSVAAERVLGPMGQMQIGRSQEPADT